MSLSIKDRINQELENLLQTFEGNASKVRELIYVFTNQTPLQLDEIAICIKEKKFQEAAKIIHKIKVRYAYLGLNELTSDFEKWEYHLKKQDSEINHIDVLLDVKDKTGSIIKELKQTVYFQSEGSTILKEMPLTGKLVLVAEDDEINAMVFDLFIKGTGADTILASDGMQAISLATEKEPDLIFMDVHMPFFSGLEAIKELRKAGCKCPIVSLSASTRLNERQNSIDAGADSFLIKPINRVAVNTILLRYLS